MKPTLAALIAAIALAPTTAALAGDGCPFTYCGTDPAIPQNIPLEDRDTFVLPPHKYERCIAAVSKWQSREANRTAEFNAAERLDLCGHSQKTTAHVCLASPDAKAEELCAQLPGAAQVQTIYPVAPAPIAPTTLDAPAWLTRKYHQ